MRGAVRWWAFVALIACAPSTAQTFNTSNIGTPIYLSAANWRFAAGDDPRYADPAFDDSDWKILSLQRSFEEQGIPIPNGVFWLRIHGRMTRQATEQAISINSTSYQVYVNGRLVGQQGGMPDHPGIYRNVQQVFPIPADAIASDSVVIAIRDWTTPSLQQFNNRWDQHILFGDKQILADERVRDRATRLLKQAGDPVVGLIALIIGIWAMALFRSQPEQREYLWLGLFALIDALGDFIDAPLRLVPGPEWTLHLQPILYVLDVSSFVLFICTFLHVRVNWWVRLYCLFLVWSPLSDVALFHGWIPASYAILGSALTSIPVCIFAPLLALRQFRRGDREAGALMVALLIFGTVEYISIIEDLFHLNQLSSYVSVIPNLTVGPVQIDASAVSIILFYLTIGGIMLHRSLRITREQQRTAAELEEGRSVQAFLLGRDVPAPGFTVESAYLPAQEVGGDFFQTIAGADGSLLAVIGDVAGKGLQAAMRVSMLIGVVRLSPNEAPAALLRKLNGVLLQDGGSGLTTCLAARLDASGTVTIANAGHLSPYINGRELAIDGGLPLGVAASTDYAEQIFPFAASDLMLLMSDGVVEARSASGELFGFERMAQAAAAVTAAAPLAEAARTFGQEDDITVLLLKRANPV